MWRRLRGRGGGDGGEGLRRGRVVEVKGLRGAASQADGKMVSKKQVAK